MIYVISIKYYIKLDKPTTSIKLKKACLAQY